MDPTASVSVVEWVCSGVACVLVEVGRGAFLFCLVHAPCDDRKFAEEFLEPVALEGELVWGDGGYGVAAMERYRREIRLRLARRLVRAPEDYVAMKMPPCWAHVSCYLIVSS